MYLKSKLILQDYKVIKKKVMDFKVITLNVLFKIKKCSLKSGYTFASVTFFVIHSVARDVFNGFRLQNNKFFSYR